jgi:exodeoxyribonuclease X
LGSPEDVKRIDSMWLARMAWPDLDSHSLGACTYHLLPGIEAREMLKNAHSAAADIVMCFRVFVAALDALKDEHPVMSWSAIWRLSEAARVPKIMPFGKHQGAEIRNVPIDYVDWYRRQESTDPYLIKAFANAGLCPQPQETAA